MGRRKRRDEGHEALEGANSVLSDQGEATAREPVKEALQPPEPAPAPKPAKQPAVVRVAKGKAIVCRRGVLSDGDAIEPRDVVGGEETIKRLLASGALTRA